MKHVLKQQLLMIQKKKCVFNEADTKCEEKTLCSKVDSPSKQTCSSAITEDEKKTRCFYDPEPTGKCVTKEICSQVTSPDQANCGNAITLDPKTKCTFVSGGTSCSIVNKKCTEITEE